MLVKKITIPTPLGEGMSRCLCHPSSNGAPYARWILCCVVVGACYGLWTHLNRPSDNVDRGKRWSHDKNFEDWSWDPKNPYETNTWYRYVKFTVRAHTQAGCYVCSKLPPSSTQVHLEARAMNVTEAKCMASMGGVGYQHRVVKVSDEDPFRPGLAEGTCDQLFWTNLNVTVKGRTLPQVAYTERRPGVNYTCYIQGSKTHKCIDSDCSPGGNWMGALDIAAECQDRRAISVGEGSPTNMSAPSNGTYFIQNGWWLCGHKVYPMLPASWTGVCAPVWVTDHTYRIRHRQLTTARNSSGRQRRAVATFDPHDPIWGANVPDDHKVWSVGDKVVGKHSLFIETLNYRFQSFVNLSLQVNDGQNREIQAIRLMVLQNRMVLDLLTAAQGGVCHIIGTSCCTYIPGENDTHIYDAMASLKNLQQAMSNDRVPQQWGFFSWLFSGNWWQLLLKLVSPVLVVLVLCLFTTCVIPCLKSAVTRYVSSTVAHVNIQLLSRDGCDDHDETRIA
ncbi:uncharacterized protein LOC133167425 [Syngnathus typhle]|uniref:uncharacterized protein LOC133167425 n=1 Tax=Syngnathus typhle TaxID=161592 RepID=UPI002A6A5752|nr:uncharacterized protein LOC133167425 [Syngnathus typhle]